MTKVQLNTLKRVRRGLQPQTESGGASEYGLQRRIPARYEDTYSIIY